ncbi:MAG: N-acetyltransferase [Cyanobacteria bacterium P01_E01_bin.6]
MIHSTINIRQEQPEDYEAIAHIYTEAFGGADEATLVQRIRTSDRYIPELALVAEWDDLVVGHLMLSYADLVGKDTFKILILAPMGVLPEMQNRAIGSSLMRRAVAIADDRGEPLINLLGHPTFYPRFGFKKASMYGIEPPFSFPDDAFMVLLLGTYQSHLRGKLRYPSAFDALLSEAEV